MKSCTTDLGHGLALSPFGLVLIGSGMGVAWLSRALGGIGAVSSRRNLALGAREETGLAGTFTA